MIDLSIIIALLVFTGVVLLWLGIAAYQNSRQRKKEIIRKIQNVEEYSLLKEPRDVLSFRGKGIRKRLLEAVYSLGASLKSKEGDEVSHLRRKLLQAGYRNYNSPYIYMGFKTIFAVIGILLFFFAKVLLFSAFPGSRIVFFSVISGMTGFYLPNIWVSIRTGSRKDSILKGFPDALDLMVVCVEAGMGLDAAINRVGEEIRLSNKVLGEEFRVLSLELRAGKTRQDALRNLAVRTGLDDVSSLVTLLVQTDRFGTSIAQALRVHSDAMRTKRYQRAEEIAAKLPVKLVFPLILFIFPALFVVIIGPAVIKIYRVLFPALGGQ